MTTKLNLAGNIPLNIDVETKKIGLELILGYVKNARRDSENAELKSRVGELEARLALLEQGSAVDGMALSFGQTQNDKEAMPVVTVPTVDVPDSVIDQLNNEVERAPSDLRMTCMIERLNIFLVRGKSFV
ncbi:hypothetical protein GLOIN_2v1486970 [Rhizophagus irregularis DAOM 181602=DAOM 197198]|nr:hypothetical protein GLOIN_2v1486970 [Rhizophagus irregularis DAOM 181602=DAOM 197198]